MARDRWSSHKGHHFLFLLPRAWRAGSLPLHCLLADLSVYLLQAVAASGTVCPWKGFRPLRESLHVAFATV
jgi:hypothetical protein